MLDDGDTLPPTAAQEAVQIDEIVRTFDEPTREAFQGWIRELARAIGKGRGEDLNDAIGNLPRFVASGDDVLEVLDEEEPALRALVRNSGRTLEAVNERRGPAARADRERERLLRARWPRATSRSPRRCSSSRPSWTSRGPRSRRLQELRGRHAPAGARPRSRWPTTSSPTLRDVGRLAPDLKALFRNLDPLIDESRATTCRPRRDFIARRRAGVRGAARVPARAEPDPVLRQLPAGAAGRLHHERRRLAVTPRCRRSRQARARATTCASTA